MPMALRHCPGSLLPVPDRRPGDTVACPACLNRVVLTEPPSDPTKDPWCRSPYARAPRHKQNTLAKG